MVEHVLFPEGIAREALNLFDPQFNQWKSQPGASSGLLEEVGSRKAAKVLEEDFIELARYMITRDNRGTRMELGALVDCLTYLRTQDDHAMAPYTADALADELGLAETGNIDSTWEPVLEKMDLPLGMRIMLDARKIGLASDVRRLKDVFMNFIHCLVLRDGNVTSEEIHHSGAIDNMLTLLSDIEE